jgi:hypothetical protein
MASPVQAAVLGVPGSPSSFNVRLGSVFDGGIPLDGCGDIEPDCP